MGMDIRTDLAKLRNMVQTANANIAIYEDAIEKELAKQDAQVHGLSENLETISKNVKTFETAICSEMASRKEFMTMISVLEQKLAAQQKAA